MPDKIDLQKLRGLIMQDRRNPDEIQRAEELLKKAATGDPESLRRITQLAFERGGFAFPLGDDSPLPPGRLFVCPKDPAHYRLFEREVGEELVCPEHGVPLRLAQKGE